MSSVSVSKCTTFIQIWVDSNALQNGSTQGIYLVDNRIDNGSTNEGTPFLCTSVVIGTHICWRIFNIDPNAQTQLQLQSISDASVWGASGQAQAVAGSHDTFTGTAERAGNNEYRITFKADAPDGPGITTTVNARMIVK